MMSLALSLRLRSFRSFHDCVVRSLSTTRHEDSEQRLLAKIAAQVNAKKLVKGGNASALHRQVAAQLTYSVRIFIFPRNGPEVMSRRS